MSFFEKLKRGCKNYRKIKYPGTEQEIVIIVLSNAEFQDAIIEAENYFKGKNITPSKEMLDDEIATQILARALRDSNNIQKYLVKNSDELRMHITRAEKNSLVEEYNALELECSPNLNTITDEEFSKIWEDIKKNPETLLSDLSLNTLRRLLLYLANQQRN